MKLRIGIRQLFCTEDFMTFIMIAFMAAYPIAFVAAMRGSITLDSHGYDPANIQANMSGPPEVQPFPSVDFQVLINSLVGMLTAASLLYAVLKGLSWRRKYGKSRTPTVALPRFD